MEPADELDSAEAARLAKSMARVMELAHRALRDEDTGLAELLRAHLGDEAEELPSVSERYPLVEHANVQLALDALGASATRWEILGLPPDVEGWGGFGLTSLIAGSVHGPTFLAAPPQYEERPTGGESTLRCLRNGVVLAETEQGRSVLLVYTSTRRAAEVVIEVVAADPDAASVVLARVEDLIREHNVLRGKVISFSFDDYGHAGITFVDVPPVRREDVVLPEADLRAVEMHTIGIGEHADELVAAGTHVKRGLLLYGPPGTGKTHTINYLTQALAGRTTIVLAGAALGAIGPAAAIARRLIPTSIVIEDVDLIASDRSRRGFENNPMLFQLLNVMDGLGADADVLFILTTNRVDMLEEALTARPGRIDQAIEFRTPDAELLARLVELYVPGPLDQAATDRVVARLEGAAPAFVKELGRRVALRTVMDGGDTAAAVVNGCLDDMIEHSTPILRASLAGPGASSPSTD